MSEEEIEYKEDETLEQTFKMGDLVRVYDSRFSGFAQEGLILSLRKDADGFLKVTVECEDHILQVSEIQCKRLKKATLTMLWLKWDKKNKTWDVSAKEKKGYMKVKEVES